ncbi:MAG: hypothetical protein MJA84_00940, partial [Firmicutes bacterium]|nr:hypothetical protein [Bacillota bacterium]
LILILPFADRQGAENIEKKIRKAYSSHSAMKNENKKLELVMSSVTFPDDGRIKENLLDKLQSMQNCSVTKV